VLFSKYLAWWRRRWRFEVPAAEPPDRAARHDPASESADRDAIRRALAGLSRQQRAVVVLRYVEDLSVVDTAAVLGCSEGTVKVQSGRALAALRVNPNLASVIDLGVQR
jgi:RNA polymerase sigma factor (sigma-70 family)